LAQLNDKYTQKERVKEKEEPKKNGRADSVKMQKRRENQQKNLGGLNRCLVFWHRQCESVKV
jgi:hypothetical protein